MERNPSRWVATGLAIVAALGIVATSTTMWAHRYPLDSDRFATAAAGVLDDPEVVEALSSAATDEAIDLVLAVADPRQFLPGPLQGLGGEPERWIRDQVAGQMERVVTTEQVQDLLTASIREAHREVLSTIRGDDTGSGILAFDGQTVRLDLTGVIAAGLDALVGRGWAPGALGDLHEAFRSGLDGLRLWLVDNVGVDIGEDIGTLVVYDASDVDDGGLALRSARWMSGAGSLPLLVWPTISLVSIALLVGLRADRARSLAIGGAAAVVLAILAHLYVLRVVADIAALVDDPGARQAVEGIAADLVGPLLVPTGVIVVGGALVALLAARSAESRPTAHV